MYLAKAASNFFLSLSTCCLTNQDQIKECNLDGVHEANTYLSCHVRSAWCTSPRCDLPRVICCCWACHSKYLAASKSVSMLIARKPSRQATRWPGTEEGKRPRGVGSVPLGSAVCTVNTSTPGLFRPHYYCLKQLGKIKKPRRESRFSAR